MVILCKFFLLTKLTILVVITSGGQVMRTKVSEISLVGRNTQGVKVINLSEGEQVVSVENIVDPVE
jgi:DNA gyrase subunit A